jgi:hypothetical protein
MQELYLYHYGVKGMHWGVRRTLKERQANRLSNYKARQTRKLDRYNEKRNKRLDRKIDRTQQKLDTMDSTDEKWQKTSNRLKKTSLTKKYVNAMYEAERKKVSGLQYRDMSDEKKQVGKTWVKSILNGSGYLPYANLNNTRQVLYFYFPDSKAIRTNARLNPGEQGDVYKKVYGRN